MSAFWVSLISCYSLFFGIYIDRTDGHILPHVEKHTLKAREVAQVARGAATGDVATTEYVTTSSTCSWVPFTTTLLPMTTVYAVLVEGLNPAAAVGPTITTDGVAIIVVATGVQNIGTCVVTAPDIITTTRVQTGMKPTGCSSVTSTVTQTITAQAGAGTNTVVVPTTIVSTEFKVSVSQQTVTLAASSSKETVGSTASSTTSSELSSRMTSSSASSSSSSSSSSTSSSTRSTTTSSTTTEPDPTLAPTAVADNNPPVPSSECSDTKDCSWLDCDAREGSSGKASDTGSYGCPKCGPSPENTDIQVCLCSGFGC